MQQLKDFWILITTPGTQLPASTTIIVLAVIAACAFLMPSFMHWRAYRRKNPAEDPRQKFQQKAGKSSSPKKKKKK